MQKTAVNRFLNYFIDLVHFIDILVLQGRVMMIGSSKGSTKKRDAILQAARVLFAQKGVGGASITDIAAKANVSRVTLFKYFGDKDALAREVIIAWVEQLMVEYDAVLQSNLPFPKKLMTLLNTRIAGREKIGEQFIHTAAWEDPELTRLIGKMASYSALPKIMQLLEEGKRTGHIDASLDNEAILVYFSACKPLVTNPEYIKKEKAFHMSLFNLFMGGLIKNWYGLKEEEEASRQPT